MDKGVRFIAYQYVEGRASKYIQDADSLLEAHKVIMDVDLPIEELRKYRLYMKIGTELAIVANKMQEHIK